MKASKDGLWAYEMNEVAAVLWDGIEADSTPESLAAKLQEVFDISSAEALRDTNEFLTEMKSIGALD